MTKTTCNKLNSIHTVIFAGSQYPVRPTPQNKQASKLGGMTTTSPVGRAESIYETLSELELEDVACDDKSCSGNAVVDSLPHTYAVLECPLPMLCEDNLQAQKVIFFHSMKLRIEIECFNTSTPQTPNDVSLSN